MAAPARAPGASSPDYVLHLGPATRGILQHTNLDALPPAASGHIRVVCISDTHNEHDTLRLPPGDLLIHAGDVLTESGKRHVSAHRPGVAPTAADVSATGVELLRRFASWLGAQPHSHKLVIGGNHDAVLEGLGPARVREVLRAASAGTATYLEHEGATLGRLRVFGSPHAHWGGHNDAFLTRAPDFSSAVPALAAGTETHIVVTHMPPLLPRADGSVHADAAVVTALHRVRARLHVGGHCHWAHGLYRTPSSGEAGTGAWGGVPCVVASVCGSDWRMGSALRLGPSGARGDAADARYGGYNVRNPVVVVDVEVPGGAPAVGAAWVLDSDTSRVVASTSAAPRAAAVVESVGASGGGGAGFSSGCAVAKPALLFFGPPNDPETVDRLLPLLEGAGFDVHLFDESAEAVACLQCGRGGSGVRFSACISKLGTPGNLGVVVLRALREAQAVGCDAATPAGSSASAASGAIAASERRPQCVVIIHSATAAANAATQASLRREVGVDLFVDHTSEAAMWPLLQPLLPSETRA